MTEQKPSFPHSQQEFLEFRGDIDIFTPKNKEGEYLETHGILLHRLDNGVLIAAATREVTDENSANINVHFPTGSYYEERRLSGVTHLLEHFCATQAFFEAPRHDVGFNALTSVEGVNVVIQGTSNPAVLNYGVWPIIPLALTPLAEGVAITGDWLEKEKRVVVGERHEKDVDLETVVQKAIGRIIFDAQNPLNYNGLGTDETLTNITVEEILRRFSEVFIPHGTVATIACTGSKEITGELTRIVEGYLLALPDLGRKPERLGLNFKGQINPDFKNGGVYFADSGLNNRLVTIQYSWVFPSIDYTTATFGDYRFFQDIAAKKLTEYFRKQGLGYVSQSAPTWISEGATLFDIRLRVPKVSDPVGYAEKLYPSLKDYVLGSLGDEDIEHVNNIVNRRTKAVPTTIPSRFDDIIRGLRYYGRIIDSDKLRELSLMTTAEQVKESAEKFGNVGPAVIVVGDIK